MKKYYTYNGDLIGDLKALQKHFPLIGIPKEPPLSLLKYLKVREGDFDYDLLQKHYTDTVQRFMDAMANMYNFDNISTAVTYEFSDIPRFQREGKALRIWRDKVWAKCYEILDAVKAGEREVPKNELEVLGELPRLELEITNG